MRFIDGAGYVPIRVYRMVKNWYGGSGLGLRAIHVQRANPIIHRPRLRAISYYISICPLCWAGLTKCGFIEPYSIINFALDDISLHVNSQSDIIRIRQPTDYGMVMTVWLQFCNDAY